MPGPIEIHQDVAAPADVVWELITDIEHCPQFISGIQSVQRLDDGEGFGAGTRWRETRVMFGKSASEEMTVTEVEPGRSYTTQAQHGKATYTSVMSVEPNGDDACVLSMHFDAEVSGVLNKTLGAVVGKLMEGSTRKLMQQDLADIAEAAEARVI
jgi:carbon monoxide dehydrogenase subunit G